MVTGRTSNSVISHITVLVLAEVFISRMMVHLAAFQEQQLELQEFPCRLFTISPEEDSSTAKKKSFVIAYLRNLL